MIQRVKVESLASVVAEKLPKLPVAAEAGGLDVAGEAFLGEKQGGGGVDGARFGREVEVEGSNLYIWEVIWGMGRKRYPSGNKSISQQKRRSIIFKVPWVGDMDLFPGG